MALLSGFPKQYADTSRAPERDEEMNTMDVGRETRDVDPNSTSNVSHPTSHGTDNMQSDIIREIIIPAIEEEVNNGQHFAQLRQIYHSLILAKWYKETIKDSLLSEVYVDQNMIAGIESDRCAVHEIERTRIKNRL